MNQPLPKDYVLEKQQLPNGYVLENEMSVIQPVVEDQSKGFFNNLRNPIDLLKNESFISNAFKLITGNTTADKEQRKIGLDPVLQSISDELGELEQQGKVDTPEYNQLYKTFKDTKQLQEAEPEFDMGSLVQAAKDDPGGTLAEFANALIADPELILTPLGWEKAAATTAAKLAKTGKAIQTTGKTLAGATGAGATGAAIVAPISAAHQLEETGEIDPNQLKTETALGAGGAVLLGGLFQGLKGVLGKVSASTGKPVEEIESVIRKEVEAGRSVDEAINSVIDQFQVVPEHAQEIRGTITKLKSVTNQAAQKNPKLPDGYVLDNPPTKQGGQVTPEAAIALGVPVAGAIAGYSPEHPEGAIAGAVLAGGALLGAKKITQLGHNVIQNISKTDERIRIDNMLDRWEGDIATGQRATWQLKNSIDEAVPDKSRREALSHYLEGDTSIKLTPKEQETAQSIRSFFDNLHAFAKENGVLDSYLQDYVPHLWAKGTKSESSLIEEINRAQVSLGTKHAKQRIIPTYREGMESGLKPKTLDIAEIAQAYGNAINRAVRNKQLVDTLQKATDESGQQLIMRADKAPTDYVLIAHPSLNRNIVIQEGQSLTKTKVPVKVHPDVAPSLKFVFESTDPNIATRSLLALNFAAKRSLVSMSGFHANALIESMIMAGRSPTAIPSALKMLRTGKAGDVVDVALRAGLKLGTIEDVGGGRPDIFYKALGDIQDVMDRTLITQPVKYAFKGYEKINRAIDNIMWDKIATGGKLSVFMKEYEKAILNNIKLHQKNPARYKLKDKDVIARDVAEFVNDAFGGLNWRRIAEGVRNKYGRNFSLAVLNSEGRRAMQLLLFAPDWCVPSNTRAVTKDGYKKHQELNIGDEILVFNPESKLLEWGKVKDKYFNQSYQGNLISVSYHGNDIEMTPDHTCYVWDESKQRNEIVKAFELNGNHRIPFFKDFLYKEGPGNRYEEAYGVSCKDKKTIKNYSGGVWCPSVNTGYWVAENNGLIFITGNTIANIRILGKALPGMSRSPEQAKLHRMYLARGAMLFATIGDGINYMYSGHHIWDNRDPTTIDLGDGRRMTFSKQFMEPYEWLTETGKTALNKMGVLPKELLTQAMGVEYLNPHYSPRMFDKNAPGNVEYVQRLRHAGENFVPIFIQQMIDQGTQGAAGFTGHPIYGRKK